MLEGHCVTCKHYAKEKNEFPCIFCNSEGSRYESVNDKTTKYDITMCFTDGTKTEIFAAGDVILTQGTVLMVVKNERISYYPVFNIRSYQIKEKEINTNGTESN